MAAILPHVFKWAWIYVSIAATAPWIESHESVDRLLLASLLLF